MLLFTIGVVWAVRVARRPFRTVPLERIPAYLEMLLKRGHNGALLILTETKSKRFLQFEKYFREGGDRRLLMSSPRAPWSEGYYGHVRALCVARGVQIHETPVISESTREFLDADLEQDVNMAYMLVRSVFLDIFGISTPCLVNVQTSGISAKDEAVTR
ncbi:MAG TPA: hypothetical protein VFO18_03740 [Methylomirabilota bacterium]|nr:hypothetical protein [Methylomirabilota bacterium]